jgi:cytochrome c oxidase subunit 2
MNTHYGWGLPINISKHGAGIDQLIYIIHALMAVLFVGWLVFFVIALIRFRSNPKAPAANNRFKLPVYLEIFIAIFEIALLSAFSFPIMRDVANRWSADANAVQVKIIAEQFAWNMHYPGPDKKFGRSFPQMIHANNAIGLDAADPAAADDIVTINELHVPENTPVNIELSSKDVIHSFAIPVMRVKRDVIPGQVARLNMEATKTGSYEIACAQLCGLGHYRMKAYFHVDIAEQFNAWLTEQGLL